MGGRVGAGLGFVEDAHRVYERDICMEANHGSPFVYVRLFLYSYTYPVDIEVHKLYMEKYIRCCRCCGLFMASPKGKMWQHVST